MSRSNKEQSLIITALGVQMTIWQNLAAAVRANGGNDQDIYRLATPEGQPLVERMGQLIAKMGQVIAQRGVAPTEPKSEVIVISGREFRLVTYPSGGREVILGEVEANYDQPLEDKIAACSIDGEEVCAEPLLITGANFPPKANGRKVAKLALVDFQRALEMSLAGQPMRGVDIYQALDVIKCYPGLRNRFEIHLEGQSCRDGNGQACLPLIRSGIREHWLGLRAVAACLVGDGMWHLREV